MNKEIKLINPEIHTSTWIPVGKSNMESLNRFVGSHKRYKTPTEFGSSGEVKHMESGTFKMDKAGIFLTPEAYDFTNFLQATIREEFNQSKVYGVNINKNGNSSIGIKLQGTFNKDEIKCISGKLSYKITDCIFPILNDQQRALINTILDVKEDQTAHHKVQTYSIVIAEQENIKEKDSAEIFKQHDNAIEAISDWVISHTTIHDCHIFIGMSATVCLGSPNEEVKEYLRFIQYLQAANKTSHHLHACLWSIRKKTQNARTGILKGNYKVLKHFNEVICELNCKLLKVKVYDGFLREETDEMRALWKKAEKIDDAFYQKILQNYIDEVDKSKDRNTTIDQLTEELSVLSSELENRLELIMTRDSMTLNIILLIMTVISVFGVAEVVGFSHEQWKIVAIVIVPFSIAALIYLRNFIKNFLRKL